MHNINYYVKKIKQFNTNNLSVYIAIKYNQYLKQLYNNTDYNTNNNFSVVIVL